MGVAVVYIGGLLAGFDISFTATILDYGFTLFQTVTDYVSSFGAAVVGLRVQLPVVVLWLLGMLIIGMAVHRGEKVASHINRGGHDGGGDYDCRAA